MVPIKPSLHRIRQISTVNLHLIVKRRLRQRIPQQVLTHHSNIRRITTIGIHILTQRHHHFLINGSLRPLINIRVVLRPRPLTNHIRPRMNIQTVTIRIPPNTQRTPQPRRMNSLIHTFKIINPRIPLRIIITRPTIKRTLLTTSRVQRLRQITRRRSQHIIPRGIVITLKHMRLRQGSTRITPNIKTTLFTHSNKGPHRRLNLNTLLRRHNFHRTQRIPNHLRSTRNTNTLNIKLTLSNLFTIRVHRLIRRVHIIRGSQPIKTSTRTITITGHQNPNRNNQKRHTTHKLVKRQVIPSVLS